MYLIVLFLQVDMDCGVIRYKTDTYIYIYGLFLTVIVNNPSAFAGILPLNMRKSENIFYNYYLY